MLNKSTTTWLIFLLTAIVVQASPAANCNANGPDANNPCCNMPLGLWDEGALNCAANSGDQQLLTQRITYFNQNNCWGGSVDFAGDTKPNQVSQTADVFDFVAARCNGKCVLTGIECTNSISCDEYQVVHQNPLTPYVAGFWSALVILLLLALSNVCYCFCNWRHKRKLAAQQGMFVFCGVGLIMSDVARCCDRLRIAERPAEGLNPFLLTDPVFVLSRASFDGDDNRCTMRDHRLSSSAASRVAAPRRDMAFATISVRLVVRTGMYFATVSSAASFGEHHRRKPYRDTQ
jgi:hypothetical protein